MSSLLLLQRGDVRRAAVGSAQMAQAEMSGLFFLGSRQGVTKGTLRWDAIKMSVTGCYQLWTASLPPHTQRTEALLRTSGLHCSPKSSKTARKSVCRDRIAARPSGEPSALRRGTRFARRHHRDARFPASGFGAHDCAGAKSRAADANRSRSLQRAASWALSAL